MGLNENHNPWNLAILV